jgi:predicted acetyltransferase
MSVKTQYEIKAVPETHLNKAVELWSLAFNFPYNIDDGLNYAKEQLSHLFGAFHGGELAAVAGIINFQIKLNDQWLECGGIAAIATSPEYRRQNTVNQLVSYSLNYLNEQKIPISTLWPFSYSFYERMGWANTNWQYQIELDLQGLHKLGNSSNYKSIALQDYHRLVDIHERHCQEWNLSIKRNDTRWKRLLLQSDFGGKLFLHQDGYILFDLKNSRDGILNVKEWVHNSTNSLIDGLALLGQMDSQFKKATWVDGSIDYLDELSLLDKANIHLKPGMMSRVVSTNKLCNILNISQNFTVKDPLGISGDKSKGDIGPGELIQVLTKFSTNLSERFISLQPSGYVAKSFSRERY